MVSNMMRIAGRGEDGTSKPLKTDNAGQLIIKQTPVTLETMHQDAVNVSGNGASAVVAGYSSIAFQVTGSFVGRVFFEGTIHPGSWEKLPVVSESGSFLQHASGRGIYKADISGYREIRARVEWTSGTNVRVRSIATLSGSTKDLTVNFSRQNVLLHSIEDDYQLTRHRSFYGNLNRGSTDPVDRIPVDYSNHSKKTLFVVNKFDVDMKITDYYKYTQLISGSDFIERVNVDILIPANGGVARLSYLDYPELLDPFLGMAVQIQAVAGSPQTGTIKLQWLGGN